MKRKVFTICLMLGIMTFMLCACAKAVSIDLSESSLEMAKGDTAQLKAEVKMSDGSTGDMQFKWSSSDEGVALVNSEGLVTAKGEGACNIICTGEGDLEASCTVQVEDLDAEEKTSGGNTIINNYYNTYNDKYGAHFAPDYEFRASDFVFPESSVRDLSESEIEATLSSMTGSPVADSYAQDAINEIYARNGYIFKKNLAAKSYYESKPWYYGDPDFTTADFNQYEKRNIGLLEKYR